MDLDLQPQLEEAVEAQGETPVTHLVPANPDAFPQQVELMPAMSVEQAIVRKQQIVEFVSKIMVKDHDFGTIPGTDKPTLYKPGGERLASYFGLSSDSQTLEAVYDWMGKDHGGEPFFSFTIRCVLSRGGVFIVGADGHCNSWEKKYRYRKSGRKCPVCGSAAIMPSQYSDCAYYCNRKKDGCGAKIAPDSPHCAAIEAQVVEKVPNPEIADQVNTILKMAEKRAFLAAVLIAVNASEFFSVGEHTEARVDEGPPETQEEVKERLLKGGPAAARADEPTPTAIQEFDYGTMMRAFKEVKNTLHSLRGQVGWDFYYATLGASGLEHANEIRSKKQGDELWKVLASQAKAWRKEDEKSKPPIAAEPGQKVMYGPD